MALGVNLAFIPLHLFSVGFPGLGVLIHYTMGFGVGIVVFLMNIPLFLLAWKYIGRAFVIKNIIVAIVLSIFLDLLYPLSQVVNPPLWLGIIAGGLLIGVGTGLVFRQGLTSGGVGLLARLIQLRFPNLQMGPIHIVYDASVLLLGAIIMDVMSAFYTFLAAIIMARMMDVMKTVKNPIQFKQQEIGKEKGSRAS
ncbi:YitT family protein [bacterium LRH843]|nr:YitT family protein [bacterium LRH843]